MDRKQITTAIQRNIHHLEGGQVRMKNEWIAREAPLEIRLSTGENRRTSIQYLMTMRTPGNDDELAKGLLFSEGIIESNEHILAIHQLDPNVIELTLGPGAHFDFKKYKQRDLMTSSCGICGKSSLEAVSFTSRRLAWSSKIKVNYKVVLSLPGNMRKVQEEFERTGGVHAAGLFDVEGNLLIIREDIGRHNALDKLVGSTIYQDLSKRILLLSGRSSFELVQKTAMLGIPILVSIGPASSMAIEVAAREGITLIGFLKENRFNIYTGQERII